MTCANTSVRYILQVDIEYLDELYELPNGYPLAPKEFNHNVLSKYCSSISNKYNIKKLVALTNSKFS